eukprot:TRINITY_DN9236_c0_g1_i1.p2 TRINITY_DN9236_c0_g1~~TRINITY_DN9236_c0_g1_i1.p2  ORF type:complete len:151 (-),score=11.30 TRINITY_DN9236_c0_g1_i1:213-665(-)
MHSRTSMRPCLTDVEHACQHHGPDTRENGCGNQQYCHCHVEMTLVVKAVFSIVTDQLRVELSCNPHFKARQSTVQIEQQADSSHQTASHDPAAEDLYAKPPALGGYDTKTGWNEGREEQDTRCTDVKKRTSCVESIRALLKLCIVDAAEL